MKFFERRAERKKKLEQENIEINPQVKNMDRAQELHKLIEEANRSYYVLDNPIMSDKSYDKLLRELEELEGKTSESLHSVKEKVTLYDDNEDDEDWFEVDPGVYFPSRSFRLLVVGCRYDNEDGTSRKEIIQQLKVGDPVSLQPYKYQGNDAVFVLSGKGIIGNVPAKYATEFTERVNDESIVSAKIRSIDTENWYVDLTVTVI